MIDKQSEKTDGQARDSINERALLSIGEAAARLGMTKRQVLRLARIYDLAHVEIDREFFFRPEALVKWAQHNEQRALV